MTPPLTLEDVVRLFAEKGRLHYGEGVSQLEHALQCASLAEAAGEPDSLVVAALLHDIGHLTEDEADVIAGLEDDRHEVTGARMLRGLFSDAVRRPIALHVAAVAVYLVRRKNLIAPMITGAKAAPEGTVEPMRAPLWRLAIGIVIAAAVFWVLKSMPVGAGY